MTTLRNGKWNHQIATNEEVNQVIQEIENMINKYNWKERTLSPYSHRTNIMELVKGWKLFSKCTFSSKQIIISEINGAIEILNAWEKYELEEKVKVILPNGKEKEIGISLLEDYLELGAKRI